jgi:diadenosine tetraphosphate (Ap4A) HIT family hydrolase
MACNLCDMIEGKKKAATLYQDGNVTAFLPEQPATIGHIIVAPHRHAPIFEATTDDESGHLFKAANKISIALFEAIKCDGTNILINNGIDAGQEDPHFSVNIIARREGDGLSFEWTPRQLGEQEMATIELQLKEELAKPEEPAEEKKEEADQKEAEAGEGKEDAAGKKEQKEEPEESYLIRQLKRMP